MSLTPAHAELAESDVERRRLVMGRAERVSALFASAAIFVVAFLVSKHLLDVYIMGDQLYYRRFYNALTYAPLWGVRDLQIGMVGSSDPLFGVIMWIGAQFFDKNVYVSFFNAIFCVQIFLFLYRNRVPIWVFPLFYTNFYLLVMVTSAERLKFSVIFVMFFLLIQSKVRYLFAAASILTHIQNIIVYGAGFFREAVVSLWKSFSGEGFSIKDIGILAASIIGGLYIAYINFDVLLTKFTMYRSLLVQEAAAVLIILAATVVIVRDKVGSILTMLPIAFASYVLGGSRVNMIGMMMFIFLVVRERRTSHPAFVLIMAYFSYKSLGYIESMYLYGDGFFGLSGVL